MTKPERAALLQGTLDMLILKSLQNGPQHGYQITRWLDSTSRSALAVEEGSLYPALHRMERKGWISSKWGRSDSNRRAKFYELTGTGRARLSVEVDAWQTLCSAIALVLQANSQEKTA